jgi:hypothetical protein
MVTAVVKFGHWVVTTRTKWSASPETTQSQEPATPGAKGFNGFLGINRATWVKPTWRKAIGEHFLIPIDQAQQQIFHKYPYF